MFKNFSQKGHIYCKECIYENILSQKKEINRCKSAVEMEKARIQVNILFWAERISR